MSPKYALTNNESLKDDTKKAKTRVHVECNRELGEIQGTPGKFVCPYCMKRGWPVKAKK